MRWTFQGKTLHMHDASGNVKAEVKLDPTRRPRQIDLTALDGPAEGKTVQGIYKLEKGRLTICMREHKAGGQGRPTEFAADAKNSQGVITLEKVPEKEKKGGAPPEKPGDEEELAQGDWNKLSGTWVTPFQRSRDGQAERRLCLELRYAGEDRLFNQYDEIKTADGRTEKQLDHSSVLVVKTLQEVDGKRFLVVTPKSDPPRPQFDSRIRYELRDGQLRLEGRLGTRDLTGTWSRVMENR
jgi:uncharacterized protein (TIGR03067 family)